MTCGNPTMRRLAITTAVVSALGGCAATIPAQSRSDSRLQSPIHEGVLRGSWSQGICILSGNTITYATTSNHQGKSVLDVTVVRIDSLICSDEFTVMLSPDRAIVSLGAQNVLDGVEMLGFLGNSLVLANSYEVGLPPVNEDGGIEKARVDGKMLIITSKNGNEWQIDLSNPFDGWHTPIKR
ncbi:MAG: hypothetical protein ABID61_05070 [Candidatus Micrarchaeota archaeon]